MLDVIIIGGGPAGLSAALVLGRCLRRVLICDAGQPRNAPSKAMHGFISRDGTDPAEFLRIAREQLKTYPNVEFRRTEVTDAQVGDGQFCVRTAEGQSVHARMLLLAMGIVDEFPKLNGLERYYGRTIHHCPYCDGWEHRDEPIAVFGSGVAGMELAIELLGWSKDVVLCTNGKPELSRDQLAKLEARQVRVIEESISALEGPGDKLECLRFANGERLSRTALFFSSRQRQRNELARSLGCKMNEEGAIECCIETAETCIPGLFAAGNASRGLQLVIIAAAEGTRAAFAINQALLAADLGA